MSTHTTCENRLPLSVRNPSSRGRVYHTVTRLIDRFLQYHRSFQSRRVLKRLDDRQLRDIGLTRNDLGVDFDEAVDNLDRTRSGFPR